MVMDRTGIIYISAEVVVGLTSALGNSIVLLAILKTRSLHTATNVFVGNLAIADIAVGFLVAPLAALSFKGLPRDFYGCVLINSLILLFTNVSIFMLLAVALERFLAIKEPFTYKRVMTVGRAIKINLAVWLLGTVLGLVPVYGWNSGNKNITSCQFTAVITYEYMVYFQFFGLVLVPLAVMLGIYIYIFIIVRRHTRQTDALHRCVTRSTISGELPDGRIEARDNYKFHKDVRAAKMFAILITLFGVFWFPVNIFNCLSLFCPDRCKFSYEALLVAIVMSHANSCVNPLVYAASNTQIRRAIKLRFGVESSTDESNTNPNNDAISSNSITANRQGRETFTRHSPIPPHHIFTIRPTPAVEVAENMETLNVSAPYYTSIEPNSLSTYNAQNNFTEQLQVETIRPSCFRRTSLPILTSYSANHPNVYRSPSFQSTSEQLSSSAKHSHSPVPTETRLNESQRPVKLFCVGVQSTGRTHEHTSGPVYQAHHTKSQLYDDHEHVHLQNTAHQGTFSQHNHSLKVGGEGRSGTRRHALDTPTNHKVGYTDDEKGKQSDPNRVHFEDELRTSTKFDDGIVHTEASREGFRLDEITSPPLIENLSTREFTRFNDVFRTSALPLADLHINSLDFDLDSEDTASSRKSRSRLKSPSLFSELEESSMAQSKWAVHTKL